MSRTLDRSELLEDGFRECSGSLLFGPVGEVPVAGEGPAEGVRSSAGTLGKRALRLDGVRGCAGELLCDPTVEFPAAVKGTVEGLRVAAGTLGRRELRLDVIRGGSNLSLVLSPPHSRTLASRFFSAVLAHRGALALGSRRWRASAINFHWGCYLSRRCCGRQRFRCPNESQSISVPDRRYSYQGY
jgi:hypothetical protein